MCGSAVGRERPRINRPVDPKVHQSEVGPEDREGVSRQFLCETLNEQEQQFLELIEAGRGVIQGDELTIANEAGTTASFRRQ